MATVIPNRNNPIEITPVNPLARVVIPTLPKISWLLKQKFRNMIRFELFLKLLNCNNHFEVIHDFRSEGHDPLRQKKKKIWEAFVRTTKFLATVANLCTGYKSLWVYCIAKWPRKKVEGKKVRKMGEKGESSYGENSETLSKERWKQYSSHSDKIALK